jgi:hypothetical protein
MTDSTSNLPPAGWYPDPAGSGRTRWWDGRAWTEQFAETGQPAYVAAPQPYSPNVYSGQPIPRAPEGTSPYTPFVWALAFLPIIELIWSVVQISGESLAFDTDYISDPNAPLFTATDLLGFGVSTLIFGLGILFVILDYRALVAAGVPKPFHWAWGFFLLIGLPVYIIGRSIVVRRRTGSGLAPMIVNLAILATSFVFAIVVAAILTVNVVETIPLS